MKNLSHRMNLADHWIETATRRRLQFLQQSIAAADDPAPGEMAEYELLAEFADSTDFGRLRNERPELAGGTDIDIVVEKKSSGRFEVKKNGRLS